jgi:hypothetical protein
LAGTPRRYLRELYESFGKRVACMVKVVHVHTVGVQKEGKVGVRLQTYEVKCVLTEEPLAVFPGYRGADFSFRVFVEEDVEGHAGFH